MPQPSMTRRESLALALAFLALPGTAAGKSPTTPKIGKKGLCLSDRKRSPEKVARFLESVGAHWLYNWNIELPKIRPKGVAFSPLIYRVSDQLNSQLTKLKSLARTHRYTELLGFNEPDAPTQGNTTVQQALAAWPKLQATGLRLGSPATVHPDNEWMIEFMKGVEKRKLRVDFICMHSYGGPGVDSLIKKIEKVHALFKRPIWITEFAVADWEAKTAAQNRHKPEKIAAFVTELLPKLEAMDIVERYAWFHGGVSGGPLASSKLFNPDGSLTIVGKAYRSFG